MIRLIDRSLRAALERAGLELISTEGHQFDPRVHEVLLREEAPGHAEGEVVRELRPDYRPGDRILRPAQVSVARVVPAAPRRPRKRGATEPSS